MEAIPWKRGNYPIKEPVRWRISIKAGTWPTLRNSPAGDDFRTDFPTSPYAFQTQIVEFLQQIAQLAALACKSSSFWPSSLLCMLCALEALTSVSFIVVSVAIERIPTLLILMKSLAEKPPK